MSKQKLLIWLFPKQETYEAEPIEVLSNKKFIFMSIAGILFIAIMKVLFNE